MYKLKFTILQLEIIRLLCIREGSPLNARRLSQYLKVSQTAIAKSLPYLEEQKFIKVRKDAESGRLEIQINSDNPQVVEYKIAENLRMFYESGLAHFLSEKFPKSSIILYGDYSKGKDKFPSELNLAVIGSDKKKINLIEFEKILERKIKIIFLSSINKAGSEKKDILSGINIKGGIEL